MHEGSSGPPGRAQPTRSSGGCLALLGCLLLLPLALLMIPALAGGFSSGVEAERQRQWGRRMLWWIQAVLLCWSISLLALLVFTLASLVLADLAAPLVMLAQGIIAGCILLVGLSLLFLTGYLDRPRPRPVVAPFFTRAGIGVWFGLVLAGLVLAQVALPQYGWVLRLLFGVLAGSVLVPFVLPASGGRKRPTRQDEG